MALLSRCAVLPFYVSRHHEARNAALRHSLPAHLLAPPQRKLTKKERAEAQKVINEQHEAELAKRDAEAHDAIVAR